MKLWKLLARRDWPAPKLKPLNLSAARDCFGHARDGEAEMEMLDSWDKEEILLDGDEGGEMSVEEGGQEYGDENLFDDEEWDWSSLSQESWRMDEEEEELLLEW